MEDDTKTDARAETPDKPSSQARTYTPPPDNPGSPGQPSRLESHVRTREAQQAQDTGSSPPQERDDKPASTQTETSGKPEDRETGDDERRPEGSEAERPPGARDQQYRPPPDNPGSPGQPSRLESFARAREAQEANAAQRPEAADGGGEPRAERDTEPAAQSPESGTEKPQAPADQDRDTGATERPDQHDPHDNTAPADEQRTDEPGARDHPTAQAPEEPTDDSASDTDQPQDQEALPRQDDPQPGPGETAEVGDRPGTEPPDTSDNQADRPQSPTHDNDIPGAAPRPESETPAADTGSQVDETGEQQPADSTPPPPAETDQSPGTQEHHGEHDGDRDRKADEPETTEPGDENNSPDRDRTQSGETEEPGTELAPHETNTAEVEEPSRFQGHTTIYVDSDGRPIPPSRDTRNDTPDHAEPRRPEDDPVSRDYRASDPEHRSRGRDFMREFVTKSDDVKTAADKFAEPAQKKFERVEPTGQLCGTRGDHGYIRPLDQAIKAGNAMLGGVGMVIVLTEAVRYGARSLRRTRGRAHASN